jgi:hypothetical protein
MAEEEDASFTSFVRRYWYIVFPVALLALLALVGGIIYLTRGWSTPTSQSSPPPGFPAPPPVQVPVPTSQPLPLPLPVPPPGFPAPPPVQQTTYPPKVAAPAPTPAQQSRPLATPTQLPLPGGQLPDLQRVHQLYDYPPPGFLEYHPGAGVTAAPPGFVAPTQPPLPPRPPVMKWQANIQPITSVPVAQFP